MQNKHIRILSCFLLLISGLYGSCVVEDEVELFGPDLTRNIPYEESWFLEVISADSISRSGEPYYLNPPKFASQINFWLERTRYNPRKYIRRTWHWEAITCMDYQIFTDTVEVNALDDSIVFNRIYDNIHTKERPDTPFTYPWTFHGKYDKKTRQIRGYVTPYSETYRCATCPGKVYYTYHGIGPARIIETN